MLKVINKIPLDQKLEKIIDQPAGTVIAFGNSEQRKGHYLVLENPFYLKDLSRTSRNSLSVKLWNLRNYSVCLATYEKMVELISTDVTITYE